MSEDTIQARVAAIEAELIALTGAVAAWEQRVQLLNDALASVESIVVRLADEVRKGYRTLKN